MPEVMRAETFYLPPPSLPPDAWNDVPPAERALKWHEVHAQRRLPDIPRDVTAEPLHARIDAGRWIAECPCGCAHVVSPADPHMLCTICLDGWHPLIFPADPATAEAEVSDEPRRTQFWYHPGDEQWREERMRRQAERAAQRNRDRDGSR